MLAEKLCISDRPRRVVSRQLPSGVNACGEALYLRRMDTGCRSHFDLGVNACGEALYLRPVGAVGAQHSDQVSMLAEKLCISDSSCAACRFQVSEVSMLAEKLCISDRPRRVVSRQLPSGVNACGEALYLRRMDTGCRSHFDLGVNACGEALYLRRAARDLGGQALQGVNACGEALYLRLLCVDELPQHVELCQCLRRSFVSPTDPMPTQTKGKE